MVTTNAAYDLVLLMLKCVSSWPDSFGTTILSSSRKVSAGIVGASVISYTRKDLCTSV